MLESLSRRLRGAMQKLASITSVDDKALNELVQEIKRALIAGDVNVKLAEELADRIRKKSSAKLPPGMSRREFLVKVVYDELAAIMGGERPEITIKPKKILLAGLFGSGKCVHPESLISLADGRALPAEEIYEEFSNAEKEINEDAEILDISDRGVMIPSFNPQTLKIENKRLTHVWRLKGKELLQINLDNGNDFAVRVTPEHPFFVLRNGMVQQARADDLNKDDFVAVPRYCPDAASSVDLLSHLRSLDLDVKLDEHLNLKEPVKTLNKRLPFRRNYCQLTADLKRGVVPMPLVPGNKIPPSMRIKLRKSAKFINFPRFLTAELAEFIGYIFGDGHLSKRSMEIVNEDTEVIGRTKDLAKILFDLDVKVKRDYRTRAMYKLQINSRTLVSILNNVFGINVGNKGKNLEIPQQIFCADSEIVRQFIRAYFDCDSSTAAHHRELELMTKSKRAAMGIKLLLLRFGIVSALSKKFINGIPYWRLRISARYAEIYASRIGYRIRHKAERAAKYHSIGIVQGCGRQDMIPLGKMLFDTRIALGFSIGEIQDRVSSYGQYERKGLISRESLLKLCKLYREKQVGLILKILISLSKSQDIYKEFSRAVINGSVQQLVNYGFITKDEMAMQITQKGLSVLGMKDKAEKLAYIEALASSDVCWLRARNIGKIAPPEHVYDFTVEDNHSFVADGIIVHNTTTSAKLARFYQKKGMSIALVCCDTVRPAAYEQLQQLSGKTGAQFYGEKGEKDASKVAKNALNKVDSDIMIFDSSGRDALDPGLVEEIKSVASAVNPDEKILVIPADIGQAAKEQASAFRDALKITDVIVTKLDATAKGGGALTACYETGAKVAFITTGEMPENLELYDSRRFVARLVGMPDLETLLEKAKAAAKPEITEKIAKADFDLEDFIQQMESVKGMGPLGQIVDMLGLGGKVPKDILSVQEEKMDKWKHIMNSMTQDEKHNPDIINAPRVGRIAKGSGTNESEVRELLGNYSKIKKMMKQFSPAAMKRGNLQKLLRQFGGSKGFGL